MSKQDASKIPYVSFAGTGNSRVKVPKDVMTKWNNVPLLVEDAEKFVKVLGFSNEIHVCFSNRNTRERWGWCKRTQIHPTPMFKILCYRQTVWVFLHELAHAIAWSDYPHSKVHGKEFSRTLTMLYERWIVWAAGGNITFKEGFYENHIDT